MQTKNRNQQKVYLLYQKKKAKSLKNSTTI